MAVELVLFDLYGTLAGFDPPREVIQQRAAAEFDIKLSREGVDAGYHLADIFMSQQNSRRPVRAMTTAEQQDFFARFEQLILREAGHEVDLSLASQVWSRVRDQKYDLALFDDVLPALDALKGDGYRCAAISNLAQSGSQICRSLGLDSHVEFVVTSGEVGVEKPDPRIFQEALRRGDVEPDRAVVVGDQLISDIGGAVGAGIRAVLMDRFNGHPGYTDHPRITRMADLPPVLRRM